MSNEWTFERAKQHWAPMTKAIQHVGVPGHQWQAGVLWDGSLAFGPLGMRENPALADESQALGDNRLHVSVGFGDPICFMDRRGDGCDAIKLCLEEGRLPIPHVETKDGDLLWHETVFAHLLGRTPEDSMLPRPDDLLVVHALFKVVNNADSSREGNLCFYFGDASSLLFGYKVDTGDDFSPSLDHKFEDSFGLVGSEVRYVIPSPDRGDLVWHSEAENVQSTKTPLKNVLQWRVPLEPGEESEVELIIPYRPIEGGTAEKLLELDSASLLNEARAYWTELLDGTSDLLTPDDFVNDYAAAVPGQMAQQIGYRHRSSIWMYKTSPNHYEVCWPCNAAKALPTLDLRGLTHLSRPVLQSFVDLQTDDVGVLRRDRRKEFGRSGEQVAGEDFERRPGFLGNFGDWTANTLLLSHGLELWALASHYRITRDGEWLGAGPESPLQAILDACDWTAAQRRVTMREQNGKKVPHWGLLPAAAAHDWLSGNTIFNDAFCIFGMIEAVRLLREIDHPRAEAIAEELNDYRACLRDRYMEARDLARPVSHPDGSEIPYVPRDTGELDWEKVDWTYTGYGPLRAGAWGALDPNHELVDQALAFLETGLPKGEGHYLNIRDQTADVNWQDISDPNADRHFLWRHYVEYETMWPIGTDLFLQRDDLPRFFEFFFNNLAVVLHQPWQVGVESLDGVPSCAPGDAERWRMIRNMFVNERGGHDGSQQSLWLLQAIPRSWLFPGSHLCAKDMGTHFGGAVDLEVHVSEDGESLDVKAEYELGVRPTEIRMRLRSGNGKPLASATVNGAETTILEADTIRLPQATTGNYRIVCSFRQ
jgi:hypothetical protein